MSPRVLISAGHTMMDPGAVFQDLREADLTREIAKRIVPHIKNAGLEVKAVPLDLPLFQRIEWINNTGYSDQQGDILVEVHINDSDGSKRGVEIWYEAQGNNNSQKLAVALMDAISTETGYPSQGVRSEFEHELGMLTFLSRTTPAAVILEALYLDNSEDIKILKDPSKLDGLALAIAKGVLNFASKDISGKDLPADRKPNFDDLIKKFSTPAASTKPVAPALGLPKPPSPATQTNAGPLGNPMGGLGAAFGGMGGGLGGSDFGAPFGGSSMMADRVERKKMIEDTYMKALGRSATPQDTNFFLNRGSNKVELLEKIIESQEHADLLKAKSELDEVKKKGEKQESEIKRAQTAVKDLQQMLNHLNQVIHHKNHAIRRLEFDLQQKHGVPSHVFRSQQSTLKVDSLETKTSVKLPASLLERFLQFLVNKLS